MSTDSSPSDSGSQAMMMTRAEGVIRVASLPDILRRRHRPPRPEKPCEREPVERFAPFRWHPASAVPDATIRIQLV